MIPPVFGLRFRLGEGAGRLVNIGKAYSGVTDAEIAHLTKFFLEHTIEDHGGRVSL